MGTLKQVFDADGIADAVDFKLTAGIRSPSYTGTDFRCVDESNCDIEDYFLCAREKQGASVHCLAAMDDASGSAQAKGQACAEAEGLDFSVIEACKKSDEMLSIRTTEANYFCERF